jgi:cysteine desulfurase
LIYLDYNATTPIDKAVAKAMLPYIHDNFGNPSSNHKYGLLAKKAVELARQQVANLIGANPSEIVFTSGGSESNNLVIKGVAYSYRNEGNHIITSQIEHPAVLNPCRYLEKNGYKITYLPVDSNGSMSVSDIEKAITTETILVTIMHANNETGTIQPIANISKICRQHKVLFHTDAAQSVGKISTKVNTLGVDFLSIAGHKLYAPKGIGAVYIRNAISIEPLIHGAGHENGRRAGTENVIFTVGLGCACEIAESLLDDTQVLDLTRYFYSNLKDIFGNKIRLNGHPENRLPNTLYISFLGYTTPDILEALPDIAISTGSACHSGDIKISPVLKAMGIKETEASAAIRFSLGKFTTREEIDITIQNLRRIV